MSTLFILNKPELFTDCHKQMQPEDGLLLIEDAVLKASQIDNIDQLAFVLEEDLLTRGLSHHNAWQTIDYDRFVTLSLEFDKSVTWL